MIEESLPLPDARHLAAAEGWLELGNAEEALAELQQIDPRWQKKKDVLELRWHACAAAKRWDACLEISAALRESFSEDSEYFIWHGNALYFSGKTDAAYLFGLHAVQKFPKSWVLHYNLACYAAQLGRIEKAKQELEKAMDLGDSGIVKMKALSDPDMIPLFQQERGLAT